MEKAVIITTINKPTETFDKLVNFGSWDIVVAGDEKTPSGWEHKGVHYLSTEKQVELGYNIIENLPSSHYGRKMTAYLYAIKNGAQITADLDDDNVPKDNWGKVVFDGSFPIISGRGFANVYEYFSDEFVWPRGFPLDKINSSSWSKGDASDISVGVWQFMADKHPDVDAIYRLLYDNEIYFNDNEQIVFDSGVVCPFNSQNTFFRKEVFPLLYMPSYTTMRFTDILRGLVAQPILWKFGYRLGFGPATVIQDRNPHDYMQDFISEVPMYKDTGRVKTIGGSDSIPQALVAAYSALKEAGIVSSKEIELLKSWVKDLGY